MPGSVVREVPALREIGLSAGNRLSDVNELSALGDPADVCGVVRRNGGGGRDAGEVG